VATILVCCLILSPVVVFALLFSTLNMRTTVSNLFWPTHICGVWGMLLVQSSDDFDVESIKGTNVSSLLFRVFIVSIATI